MFILFLKRSLVVSLASFFISGAGIAHGVEETSPLHVIETESTPVIEPESTPEVSSVPPKREPSFQAKTMGLIMMGGQFDTNAGFAREDGESDKTGSFFGQLRHERERLSAQVSFYKNLNDRNPGNDLDLLIIQTGIKFRPSPTITLIPSLKLDATWLNRGHQPFYRSYGINLAVNFEERLLSALNFDVVYRDFKTGKDDFNMNFSGSLTRANLLVEEDSLSLKPYVQSNLAYSGSGDVEVKGMYLQGGASATYIYPIMETISVESRASFSRRAYKVFTGGDRDDNNHTFGLSVSIDEFILPNQTLSIGYDHEENHSTVNSDDYTNDSISMEVLWLFF
jgi:hypothetical protein